MLLLALTPDNLARKTYRDILKEHGVDVDDGAFNIEGKKYHIHGVMEDDWDEDNQISLPEGTIYIAYLVTYGYCDKIIWDKLATQKVDLEEWAKVVCERHHCTAEIFVSANYF